ncbi:MAG: amidase [Polyangiaceae bacterium]|nr:amidase [Polyangiaceae bacterium]
MRRGRAGDARARAGISLGPLDGELVSVKDLFDVAGYTTWAGSRVLRGRPPAVSDAVIVARLRRAGAVLLGKTNMTEFAFSGIGINPHYGTPGNGLDATRVPGGSSCGAGVSICEHTSDIAIGTDTGGSVRIPASLNGCVGFKPTTARVPRDGVYPLSYTLDSVGVLAGTVATCSAADAVMAGEDPAAVQPAPIRGLRIGVPQGSLFTELEPMVLQGFETSLSRLANAGAQPMDTCIDELLDAMGDAMREASILAVEAAAVHGPHLDNSAAQIDPRVASRIAAGRGVTAEAYARAMHRRGLLTGQMCVALSPYDVLALPTTAVTAPLLAPLLVDDALYHRTNLLLLRNTSWCNLFDLTALSLPMPEMPRPAGLMLVAVRNQDRRLLSIGAAVEMVLR